ncbi:MAG TPA: 4-alpha-glucanotransferase [Candidatus Nitrosotalea sp.]|nr:4-alpha-glucanotransferase [Candidatus Nitrosotalea sp.]
MGDSNGRGTSRVVEMVIDPDAWGIEPGYRDARGHWVEATPDRVAAVLAAMGAGSSPPPEPAALVLEAGEQAHVGRGEVLTESGEGFAVDGVLPANLPLGYHRLIVGGQERELIVAPSQCPLPEGLRGWGLSCQLYAARSRRSWGVGDLADLRLLAAGARRRGAGMVMVNPLHAGSPVAPQDASPYHPSSRRWLNPLYLRVEEVPGAQAAAPELASLQRAGQGLSRLPLIDRNRVLELKMDALARIWERAPGPTQSPRWADEDSLEVEGWARFCVLCEVLPGPWATWPDQFRRPGSAELESFAAAHRGRIDFHRWLQVLLDDQLYSAAGELPLVLDLAVGSAGDGYDAWSWQDAMLPQFSLGAPPDPFNSAGQTWGLPPFDPWRLRALNYRPWRQVLRAGFRHARGLRIDHVMGLFRQYWVGLGSDPALGLYVRFPQRDLLRILALEAHRAQALVIGEDLGTVAPEVRSTLAQSLVLGCRVLYFEAEAPELWPQSSAAFISTHDLPTVAGLWSGFDPDPEIRARLAAWTGLPGDAEPARAVTEAHRVLGRSRSRLRFMQIEDALGIEARANLPGTGAEARNWCRALPLPLEDVLAQPRLRELSRLLSA